jgi:quinol monooxygenase YgiN
MHIVTVEFEIHAEHFNAFRKEMLLQSQNSLTKEEGCCQFDVCFDHDNGARCFLYEKYDDPAAFDFHLASEHFSRFVETVTPWVVNKTVKRWNL